jgi:hypothetical protein
VRSDDVEVSGTQLGAGYGVSTPAMIKAVRLMASQEGLLLDPVYVGKAFAGLLADISDGRYEVGDNVLFIMTGGSPGLYAYASDFLGAELSATVPKAIGELLRNCAMTKSLRLPTLGANPHVQQTSLYGDPVVRHVLRAGTRLDVRFTRLVLHWPSGTVAICQLCNGDLRSGQTGQLT